MSRGLFTARLCTSLLLGLAIAVSVLSLATGPAAVSAPLDWASLLDLFEARDSIESVILLDLRLPRVLLAWLTGAMLAQAGAVMQGLFRNPLADPGLVGVSGGAALGAAGAVLVSSAISLHGLAGGPLVPLAAFAGGLVAALLASALARVEGQTSVQQLLLAGIAINALAGAGIGLLLSLAEPGELRTIQFWMFGSLARADWSEIGWAALPILAILLWLPTQAGALNALLLGEAEAGHLGIEVERVKRRLLIAVVLGTACSVALCGLIGFVGLLVPHLARLAFGPDHHGLLPLSAALGALLLLVTDLVARSLAPPMELPVGVLTALIGAPFFLALLLRQRDHLERW